MEKRAKNEISNRVIVVGTSAGGLSALTRLVSQLRDDFPCPVLVVMHISPDATGDVLLDRLNQLNTLKCYHAEDGMRLEPGSLYLAPSDHHLMVADDSTLLITKGAHENRSRPAIDPLFRSAAVVFRSRLIGLLLTGYLDDGTNGMKAIKSCGGICVVQDPADADYKDMPQNAIAQVKVDHVLPLAEIGGLLYQLIAVPPARLVPVPKDISIEADIAKRVLSDLPAVNALGEQVPFNCPGCGGVLWKVDRDKGTRYRCHTGHAYTAASLLAEQTKKIEETMWTALRMFEEQKNLLTVTSRSQNGLSGKASQERMKMLEIHINRIKAILYADDKGTTSDVPK